MEGNPLEPTSLSSVIPQLRFLRAVGIDSNQARGVSSCGLIRSSGEQALRIGHMAGTGEASLNGGYFKVTRHSEAGVTDGDLAQLLVVAFGSAPGVPNWGGLLKRVKNCLESKGFPAAFDTLYVVDPRRSWYSHSKRGTASLLCDDDDDHASAALPSPDGLFFNPSSSCSLVNQESQSKKGGAISTRGATAKQFGPESYYFKELSASVKGYRRVIMLGDSMGASAALMFSQLATAVMAFCPQVDLTSASIRPSRSDAWFQSFRDNLLSAASSSSASITVHCGDWSHDLNQAQMLPKPQVQVVTHPINDHRLAKALNEQGRLVPLVAELIEKEISEAYAFL
ncbi:hypothetical protein CBR_g8363 [Chara braunii]|uniref:Uncharacterized protein n=1 Tax=Chara braunii TaxID=69332 RepID=A0A388KLX7_CHABU|nr:hypothetical protein CBR_g8363 [Chara braunii]|eukprot:GBG71064.1 hypothetical protein CBR_g8363 [Chara braunii]